LKGRDYLGDLGRDGKIILKWILKIWSVRMWAEFIWVRVLLTMVMNLWVPKKGREFLN
jgi:hypothetical protein